MISFELVLSIGLGASAAADTHSTLRVPGVYRVEGNPIMRPLAVHPPLFVGAQVSMTAVSIGIAHQLREGKHKTWWIPLAVGIGVHTAAAIHNYRTVQ